MSFFLHSRLEDGIFIFGAQCRLVVYLSRDTCTAVAVEEEKKKKKAEEMPWKTFFFFEVPHQPTLIYLDIISLSTAQAALTEIA